MKTIDNDIEIIDEICKRRKGREAAEAMNYMTELSNYYHDNHDRNAEMSRQGREIKVNWIYRRMLIYLETGEKI